MHTYHPSTSESEAGFSILDYNETPPHINSARTRIQFTGSLHSITIHTTKIIFPPSGKSLNFIYPFLPLSRKFYWHIIIRVYFIMACSYMHTVYFDHSHPLSTPSKPMVPLLPPCHL